MTKRWIGLIAVVALVIVAAPGDAQTPGPVKIAFLGSLSGPFTAWGVGVRDGMKMAVAELNDKGGVLKRPL